MRKMVATFAVIVGLLIGSLNLPARTGWHDTGNDCAIYATEAYARLRDSAAWVHIVFISGIIYGDIGGHAMTVWQITKGGHIYVYDYTGTLRLKTKSHDLDTIVAEIAEADHFVVWDAFYAE